MTVAGTVLAILASAVIVFGGLVGVVRAIWRLAQVIRDSVRATEDLAVKFGEFTPMVDGRLEAIEQRVARLEGEVTKSTPRPGRPGG